MKRAASVFLRALVLAMVLPVCLGVGAVASGVARQASEANAPPATSSPPPVTEALALPLFCVLVAATFAWTILRSRSWGWRLMGTVFLAYFGLGTFLPQIESLVFLPRQMPPGLISRLFLMGAIGGALFAPVAVLVMGRRKRPANADRAPGSTMRLSGWAWRIAFLALAYVAVYMLAGYFIAYRSADVLAYYDDIDRGSFWAGMAHVWAVAPWLFGLQAVRGALWVICLLPVILAFRGGRIELILLLGCLSAVWFVMLLHANPYMPHAVRMAHLTETVPSSFLFGCLVGAVLAPRQNARP